MPTLNQLKKMVRRGAAAVLTVPPVRWLFENICRFYGEFRVDRVSRLVCASPGDFYTILYSGTALNIRGEFLPNDAAALEALVQGAAQDRMMIAELGAWKGLSTAILAKAVAGRQGRVFAIDHWLGSEGVAHHVVARQTDIFAIFKRNLMSLGLWSSVSPLVMDSQTAAAIFADGVLDLIFIDADHRYENFKQDISAWLPKLKPGGILCGHDCEGYYSRFPDDVRAQIDQHLTEDYLPGLGHPGVMRGLHDWFDDQHSICPNSTIWYHVKSSADR